MLQVHPKDIRPAWDALNETRVSSGLEPHRRPLGRYEVVALVALLICIAVMSLLST
jgi:hypothetical protein